MKPKSLTRVGGERPDQADVRALGRLDRAHAAVVAEVDVADLEAGPLAGQAAGAERREAPAVGQARQRVDLVHELGELAGAEELLDGGDHRPDVDERLGRDGLDVLGGHALADDPLHAGQADAHLVLDQLADRADAAVGEVVLVVEAVARLGVHQVEQVGEGGEHLAPAEHRLARLGAVDQAPLLEHREHGRELLDLAAELAVQLVAPDPGQVVAAGLEEGVAEVGAPTRPTAARPAGPACRSRPGPRPAWGRGRGPSPTGPRGRGTRARRRRGTRGVLLVVAEGAQEHEQAEAALAGHPGAGGDVLARLLLDVELDPLAPVGVDGALDQLVLGQVPEAVPLARLEDDARGADELGHDDPLGAVDHEGALVGHHGEVTHEDRLLLDLAGGGVHEAGAHEDGAEKVMSFSLHSSTENLGGGRRSSSSGSNSSSSCRVSVKSLMGEMSAKVSFRPCEEPLEGFPLDRHEVRKRQGLLDVRERVPIPDASGQRITPQRVRWAWRRVSRRHPDVMAKPGTSLPCEGAEPQLETQGRDHRRTATSHARAPRAQTQPASRQRHPDPVRAGPGGPKGWWEGKPDRRDRQPSSRGVWHFDHTTCGHCDWRLPRRMCDVRDANPD